MAEFHTRCDGRWKARKCDWGVDLLVVVVRRDEVHHFSLFMFND